LHTSLVPTLEKGVIELQTLDFMHNTLCICRSML